jgi:hypothetical protein
MVKDSILRGSAITSATALSIAGFGGQITNLSSILKSQPEQILTQLNSSYTKTLKSPKTKGDTEKKSSNDGSSNIKMDGILKNSKDFLKFSVYSKILKLTMSKIVDDFTSIIKNVDSFLKVNVLDEMASSNLKVLDTNIPKGIGKMGEVFKILSIINSINPKQYSISNIIKLGLFSKSLKVLLPEMTGTFVKSINQIKEVDDDSVNKFNKILIDISKGIVNIVKSMASIKLKNIIMMRMFFDSYMNLMDKMKIDKTNIKSVNYLEMSMSGIGRSILTLWAVQKMVPGAMKSLDMIQKSISTFDGMEKSIKNVRKVGNTLLHLSKSLIAFGGSLLLFGGIIALASPTIMLGLGMLALTAGLFFLLGKGEKSISKGSKAIILMSLGLAAFATGTALMSIVLMAAKPTVVLLGLGMIALSSALFFLIGKGAGKIALGSLADKQYTPSWNKNHDLSALRAIEAAGMHDPNTRGSVDQYRSYSNGKVISKANGI